MRTALFVGMEWHGEPGPGWPGYQGISDFRAQVKSVVGVVAHHRLLHDKSNNESLYRKKRDNPPLPINHLWLHSKPVQ